MCYDNNEMSDSVNKDYDDVAKYVEKKVNDSDVRRLIADFAILWNMYENEFYESDHNMYNIRNIVNNLKLCDEDKSRIDYLYFELLGYLNHRGYVNSNYEIDYERIKNSFYFRIKVKDELGNVINSGEIYESQLKRILNSVNPIDRLHFMLVIIARVRNNMFHGLKDISELKDNKQLFMTCNKVLKLVLDVNNVRI